MGIVTMIIGGILMLIYEIITGILGMIIKFWPVLAGIVLLCIIVGMFETIKKIFPVLIGIALLILVGIILFNFPWGMVIHFVMLIVYSGVVIIAFVLIGGFLTDKLKQFKLRWSLVPILFIFILMKIKIGNSLPISNSFYLALALSIGTFLWSIFQFKFIKQHIGFIEEIDSNIRRYYSSMFVSLGCMILDLFGFSNNILYILIYLGLGFAVVSLHTHTKAYRDIETYLNITGYCTHEIIIKNLPMDKKIEVKYAFVKQILLKMQQNEVILPMDKKIEEKHAFVKQVLFKMKQNNQIVESGTTDLTFIVNYIYYEVLAKLKKEIEHDEIILAINKDFNIKLPKNVINVIFDNSVLGRRIKRDKINSEFMVLRYTIQDHPILAAGKDYQILYYKLISYFLKDIVENTSMAIVALMQRYTEILSLKAEDKVLLNSDSAQKAVAKFCSNEIRLTGIKNYKILLLLETFYFRSVIKNKIEYELLETYFQQLRITGKTKEEALGLIESFLLPADDMDMALLQCSDKQLLSAGIYLQENLKKNYMYDGLPKYNVAVCATMSSGKSTFVNALLGYDYIPSRNEACTAKITSIADNDYLDSVLGGVVQKNGEVFFGENISKEMLETWNNDNKVERVLLETDLKGIKSEKGVLVVHDTPGTNYSQDQEHHNQTMDFLKDNEINLIIYLVNAEHVSTMDNRILLQQIKAEVIEKQSSQIIFLVNKLDSFDSEKQDDVVLCLEGVKKELVDIGYERPIVLPIVANAARLFKIALDGHWANWTKRESSEFRNLYELFIDDGFDLFELSRTIIPVKSMDFEGKDDIILIDNKEYSRGIILKALQRTGITVVEELLDREINLGGVFND